MAELDLEPLGEVVGAHRQAARGHRVAAELVALVEHAVGPVAADRAADARVREGAVGGRVARLVGRGGIGHPAAREHFGRHVLFPGLAGDFLDQLAEHDVEHVVVGIGRAEAGRRLDVAQPLDGFLAGQPGARHEHQVARAEAEAAAVDHQVAHRDLARDPRVVHLEPRDVVDRPCRPTRACPGRPAWRSPRR